MDDSEIALVVLCDLSKGFDVVNRDLLMSKLKLYNVCRLLTLAGSNRTSLTIRNKYSTMERTASLFALSRCPSPWACTRVPPSVRYFFPLLQ